MSQPPKRRLYQPRTTRASVIQQRLAPRGKDTSLEPTKSALSSKKPRDSGRNSPSSDEERRSPQLTSSETRPPQALQRIDGTTSARRNTVVPIEKEPNLPGPFDPPSDYTVLPSLETKEMCLQCLCYTKVTTAGIEGASKIFGRQGEWKRRFMRVILSNIPGKERIQFYRTERRRSEMPLIKEVAHTFPLLALDHVHPSVLPQEEQLNFEHFDHDSKKWSSEFVFGHISLSLDFQHSSIPQVDLCFGSSIERDTWADFFISYICKREREELLSYSPPEQPRVNIRLHPMDGVQKFTSMFLASGRNLDADLKVDAPKPSWGASDVDPVSTTERSVSPLRWDVLIATSIIDRKRFFVECVRVGYLTVVDLGEFQVHDCELDQLHPDVFYIRPVDPSVGKALGLYMNDDRMFDFRTLQDGKKFRQWLHSCYGIQSSGTSGMRSFHSPHGATWTRGGRNAETSSNGGEDPSSSSLLLSNTPQANGSSDFSPSFFQLAHEGSLRRVQSIVIQKRKLSQIAQRALHDPRSFAWHEMASLAYVEYNVVGESPVRESMFVERIVALDSDNSRFFVLAPLPSAEIVLEVCTADVNCITGYSEIFGDMGFTLHLLSAGFEIHVVPKHEEARRMWPVALRMVWQSEHLLRDESREQVVKRYLQGQSETDELYEINQLMRKCDMCGGSRLASVICPVTQLQHAEYIEHVASSLAECGTVISSLPSKSVTWNGNVDDVIEKAKATLERLGHL